uniref:Uncharacterized protein n=1 Tax=Octopus bimaculoides TaxID=37653 RepID=A0A0L8I9B8_OCTBM
MVIYLDSSVANPETEYIYIYIYIYVCVLSSEGRSGKRLFSYEILSFVCVCV